MNGGRLATWTQSPEDRMIEQDDTGATQSKRNKWCQFIFPPGPVEARKYLVAAQDDDDWADGGAG
jgi:hypothetical protein